MNAIDFLIKEHNEVRTMLADIADENHQFSTQQKHFGVLAQNLIRHEAMEHQIWYPHFKSKLSAEVKHLIKEETNAEKEIKKLESLKTETTWKEHFLKFKKDVEHHAKEEEKELFPEVKKILSEQELLEIGKKCSILKKNTANN